MKKLILVFVLSGITFIQLNAQEPSKMKVNPKILKQEDYKKKEVIKEISKVEPVGDRRLFNNCCNVNPYVLTPCSQSLIQSFKNLTTSTGVNNCHPTLNFPTVSFAMPENCFAYQTTSASMVTYSSFYIPESKVYPGLSTEFRVIWGASASDFSYYGACPPSPIIFPHPGGATENHVFGAKLVKQSDYRAFLGPVKDYNTMLAVPSLAVSEIQILAVYMEESGGYISTTEPNLYNNIYSSKGIVVSIKQRSGPNELCYIINNYDAAGTINWKERNPPCVK
jgi:hypothetical protein